MADPRVVSELTEAQTQAYVDLLVAHAWWHKDSTRDQIARSLASSLNIGFVSEAGELLACGRAVTDFVFKALVLDVVVAPDARGQGLGTKLIHAILGHPQLRDVLDFELYCTDQLMPWYRRLGFQVPDNGVTFVRLRRQQ